MSSYVFINIKFWLLFENMSMEHTWNIYANSNGKHLSYFNLVLTQTCCISRPYACVQAHRDDCKCYDTHI